MMINQLLSWNFLRTKRDPAWKAPSLKEKAARDFFRKLGNIQLALKRAKKQIE
jgi:hypothetical protein